MSALLAPAGLESFDEAAWDREVLRSAIPVVVAFWADWNVPCRIAAPAMEEAARRTEGRVRFGIVSYDESPGLAARYEVRGLPTYLVIRNGEVCERRVGLMGRLELKRIVDSCAG